MIAIPYEEATGNTANGILNLYGGDGNDKIEGAHKANTSLIQGNDGNDKIIGGIEFLD